MSIKSKCKEGYGFGKGIVVGLFTEVTSYWKKPAKGNFVPYKELASLSIGGMGLNLIGQLLGYFGFGVGNLLLGAAIGISPMHLQMMAMIQTVLNVVMYAVRGKLVDNTRSKYGRFRPYIAVMGLPILILAGIFLFLDFTKFSYSQTLMISFAFTIAISMIAPLLTDTFVSLRATMTPNSQERAKILSVDALLYSIAPTITSFFIPILSKMTGGYTKIDTYKYIILPLAVIGAMLILSAAIGCKERVVTSKSYVQKVSLFKGIKQIYGNKYWWIKQTAGLLGFMEGAFLVILSWTFIYGSQDYVMLAFFTTILGSASTISMLITPYLMKKLGNRKLLIFHNLGNFILIFIMIFCVDVFWLFTIIFYINTVVNQLQIVYNPAQNAEVNDYQQYLSGRRMDLTFGAAGQILLPLTLAVGLVIPFLYEYLGLTVNYDILFNPIMRDKLFLMLLVCSLIGSALNLAPYVFYDLSREKHRNYIKVLRYRAVLQDYHDERLTPELIVLAVDDYRDAIRLSKTTPIDIALLKQQKKDIKAVACENDEAKIAKKAAIKAKRHEIRDAKILNEQIETSIMIFIKELNKFDNDNAKNLLEKYEKLVSIPKSELVNLNGNFIKEAKLLSKATKDDTKHRRKMIAVAKALTKMPAKIAKNYPNGLVEITVERVHKALDMPYDVRAERVVRVKELKLAEKELNDYLKTIQPITDAIEYLLAFAVKENYSVIESRYDTAVVEVAENIIKSLLLDIETKKNSVDDIDGVRKNKINAIADESKREKKLAKHAEMMERRNVSLEKYIAKRNVLIAEEQSIIDNANGILISTEVLTDNVSGAESIDTEVVNVDSLGTEGTDTDKEELRNEEENN